MKSQNNSNVLKAIAVIVIIIIIGWVFYAYWESGQGMAQDTGTTPTGTVTATSSPVSTSSSTTPVVTEADWVSISSSTTGVTFEYPSSLSTNYIQTVNWPPYITVASEAFACPQPGSQLSPDGKTSEQIINGTTYCVTTESEGAAGSIYTTYAYAFQKSTEYMILNFTLRQPQCENYPDPQMTACSSEESTYNVNQLADEMAQTVQYVSLVSPAHPIRPTTPAPNTLGLNSVSPGSGAVGTTIVLTGSGFLDSNKVLFDGNVASVNASPSAIANGYQTLTITVPSGISPDCKPDQACPMYERLVTPGNYLITVENTNGTSNAIPFIVEK